MTEQMIDGALAYVRGAINKTALDRAIGKGKVDQNGDGCPDEQDIREAIQEIVTAINERR